MGRLGIIVDAVYGQIVPYGGAFIVLLIISIAIRLYADFSGYMDIAAGICRILGIRLEENFRQPFFAKSIEEFWRRWHITLGTWFRDYLFYPILKNKNIREIGRRCKEKYGAYWGKVFPSVIALTIVWTATGLWHGAAWYRLVWGWMNLFIIAMSMVLAPLYGKIKRKLHIREERLGWQAFQMLRTFFLFGFMEMYSSSGSTMGALRLTFAMFHGSMRGENGELFKISGLESYDVVVLVVCVLLMLIVDMAKERQIDVWKYLSHKSFIIQCVALVGMIYAILILGDLGSDITKGFMYAQF